jgi:hypothetical protein
VQHLDLARSNISMVPAEMAALQTLGISGCGNLFAEWLPASSKQRLTTVAASFSSIARFTSCMGALSAIDVRDCQHLAADWLPASSATQVRELFASNATMQGLEGMPWLQAARLPGSSGCGLDNRLIISAECVLVTSLLATS